MEKPKDKSKLSDYERYLEIVSKYSTPQHVVDRLSEKINRNYLKKVKKQFAIK